MADQQLKQLKIKTGVVKRLFKETAMYEKETKQLEDKLEKMKNEGTEEVYLKKQAELIQESRMMIPDCRRRLKVAYEELSVLMHSEASLDGTEEFKAATSVLDEVKPALTASE